MRGKRSAGSAAPSWSGTNQQSRPMSRGVSGRFALPQQPLQNLDPVGIFRRLIPANAVDARESQSDAGFVPARPVDALECNLENQALVARIFDFAHRAKAVDRVIADIAIELRQLFIGDAGIGLADRHQLFAVPAVAPDSESIVRVKR